MLYNMLNNIINYIMHARNGTYNDLKSKSDH